MYSSEIKEMVLCLQLQYVVSFGMWAWLTSRYRIREFPLFLYYARVGGVLLTHARAIPGVTVHAPSAATSVWT